MRLLERDASRSPYDKPQRALALTYVHGMLPVPEYSRVSFNLIPEMSEYFVFPALTLSGPCFRVFPCRKRRKGCRQLMVQ
ncbi:styrene monooxygenase/indole monooxygenase family protein [Xenorhabdus cabanillasii]|uniref:Styrene monooxygenase StyA putative substrate binding domain-containing protein n=1 Tax=Xenorhabdus cabanillasii JM26 TaxID=1427517 RepID=W1J9D6_9GAMM|nr:styrene monooxygenase/indole monooxygenase family protein [Xenorhabdus cabanillasii]PHM75663.1 alanine-phosphoribitol ligase [Xenorhabdus cabanillasii JM26]CDL86105.1 hypothetical protein XCR1_2740007 [Xenorhabdus cabanillasii JM26]